MLISFLVVCGAGVSGSPVAGWRDGREVVDQFRGLADAQGVQLQAKDVAGFQDRIDANPP
ncbi:MAG TPA: hypothetical protein VIO57_04165 [Chloroflexota bacterium]|jgi:hypothetical protein